MADKPTHLAATSFTSPEAAEAALNSLIWLSEHGHLEIEGHALISKAADGTVTSLESQDADAGPRRGAAIGGAAGLLLAIGTGPFGMAAIAGGAAIGAVAAKLHDAGFKDRDLAAAGDLMQPGRTALIVTVKPEFTERLQNAIDTLSEFKDVVFRFETDITDPNALAEAVEAVRGAQPQG